MRKKNALVPERLRGQTRNKAGTLLLRVCSLKPFKKRTVGTEIMVWAVLLEEGATDVVTFVSTTREPYVLDVFTS